MRCTASRFRGGERFEEHRANRPAVLYVVRAEKRDFSRARPSSHFCIFFLFTFFQSACNAETVPDKRRVILDTATSSRDSIRATGVTRASIPSDTLPFLSEKYRVLGYTFFYYYFILCFFDSALVQQSRCSFDFLVFFLCSDKRTFAATLRGQCSE